MWNDCRITLNGRECIACGGLYTEGAWKALRKLEATTTKETTMGGGSGDNPVAVKTTAVLHVYPNKSFAWTIDDKGANMCNIMDLISKAAEDFTASPAAYGGNPVWSTGTREAYERLGRALGYEAPKVAQEQPAAPLPPAPPLKLAQRLAAFVEERAALQADARALHEKAFPDVPWDKSALILVVQGALAGCRVYSTVHKGPPNSASSTWLVGTAVRFFEENGFFAFFDPHAATWVENALQTDCIVRLVRF